MNAKDEDKRDGQDTLDGSGAGQSSGLIMVEEELPKDDEDFVTTSATTTTKSYLQHKCGDLEVVALIGLCVSSIAGGLVADTYGLFHVDTFLRAYELPLKVYGIGHAVFAFINTANDVVAAWWVDWYSNQTNRKRHELVGATGCLFALSFLAPFFRWGPHQGSDFWDGLHFVGSLSLYDTFFGFNCILGSSIVTDNHNMSDNDRIAFFATRRIVSMVAPVVVAKVGLSLFDVHNLAPFRVFAVVIAVVASVLSIGAQKLINLYKEESAPISYSKLDETETDSSSEFTAEEEDSVPEATNSTLNFWQVAKDFASHPNFRWWILMEMLMEGQSDFIGSFDKTFVDRLLYIGEGQGLSRETCDWLLSLMSPMCQLMGFIFYIPIQRFGYARMYRFVFVCNFVNSCLLLLLNGISNEHDGENLNTIAIMVYMAMTNILSSAIASTGFGLAMSDMVLEMKHSHTTQGRLDAPSLAGMFMGVNALFCKPMESVLPMLTAYFLSGTDFENSNSAATRLVLFRLLVFPPMVCSFLQFLVWSQYSLVPERTQQMRQELQSLKNKQQSLPASSLTESAPTEMKTLKGNNCSASKLVELV